MEMAGVAGRNFAVAVRTLHRHDVFGLLNPSDVGENAFSAK
jgi:hypothetical protein